MHSNECYHDLKQWFQTYLVYHTLQPNTIYSPIIFKYTIWYLTGDWQRQITNYTLETAIELKVTGLWEEA